MDILKNSTNGSLFNSSSHYFYADIDSLFTEVGEKLKNNIRASKLIKFHSLLNNGTSFICIVFYLSLLVMLIRRKTVFSTSEILMRVLVSYQTLTFTSKLVTQKVGFLLMGIEHYTLQTYQIIPFYVLLPLEKLIELQYPLFWFITGAYVLFQMITFTTQSEKIYRLYHLYLLPSSVFVIITFLNGSPKHMELIMLTIMFLIWCVNRKHVVSHVYTQGLTAIDILNFRKSNMMISTEIIFTILYHFLNSGLYFVMRTSIRSEERQNVYIFYKDIVFSIFATIASLLNALLLFWVTRGYFKAKAQRPCPLPVITSHQLSGQVSRRPTAEFSRRPSTISAFSVSVSPVPSYSNSNMLHA